MPFITFTIILVACMAFELSNDFFEYIFYSDCVERKAFAVNSETIAITLGCFLYLILLLPSKDSLYFMIKDKNYFKINCRKIKKNFKINYNI